MENLKNRNHKNLNMNGKFVREIPEKVGKDKTWQWQSLPKSDLRIGTGGLFCAAQEQAIRTNYVKYHIDKTSENSLYRLCVKKGEWILVSKWI